MTAIEPSERKRAFEIWLRTDRLQSVSDDGIELKFNPWHDPDDGRFTYAGAGRYHGAGTARSGRRRAQPVRTSTAVNPPAARRRDTDRPEAPSARGSNVDSRIRPTASHPISKVVEFADGVRDGLSDVGKETATALYEAATTDPRTTVRNYRRGIARMIDGIIVAEDTPARIQIRRAADTVANGSAHDIGYVTSRVGANAVMVAVPGAVVSKVSSVRRAAAIVPRPTYSPLEIGWVKENLGPEKEWTKYNNDATGSRPGQAPTLKRTLADGSTRLVKFDGIEGDTVIDRKWSIQDRPRARAQALRQSEALAQHRAIGTWEVTDAVERTKALRMLNKLGIKNIKVRVVTP